MDRDIPSPVVIHLDRDDAAPLLAAGLVTLAQPALDLAERQATLSLVCQLRTALRSEPEATMNQRQQEGAPVSGSGRYRR
jgi:hypothetical protein